MRLVCCCVNVALEGRKPLQIQTDTTNNKTRGFIMIYLAIVIIVLVSLDIWNTIRLNRREQFPIHKDSLKGSFYEVSNRK